MKKVIVFLESFFILLLLVACGDIGKKANQVLDDYNENKISYEEANNQLNEMKSNANEDEAAKVESVISDLNEIRDSKANFDNAKNEITNNNYEKALELLNKVSQKDKNYIEVPSIKSDCVDKYVASVIELKDKYVSSNKYDDALKLLENALNYTDDKRITDAKSEVEKSKAEYESNVIASKEAEAQSYHESGEYDKALTIYKSLYKETSDETYKVKQEEVENDWIDASIESAEALLSEGNYDAAANALKSAQNSVSDKKRLNDEQDRIESFRPYIFDADRVADYLYTDIYTTYRDEGMGWHYWWLDSCTIGGFRDVKDNLGQNHDAGILLTVPLGATADDGSGKIDYTINGEYDTFNCQFFLIEGSKNTATKFYLNVYADDTLVYSSDAVTGGVLPIDVKANVSGASKLTLEITYNQEQGFGDCIVVSDMSLYKEYTPL